ncbi:hypothetical protein [Streptomyces nitrosporeus]|uniref:hypothetical protein n=1 Tax=Streptomyces nitrosporeus TaxID=28894 RepID=UPI00167EDBD2|nr:hypothetical protein [Streptomyces nitrosporeus]GGZ27935.1 hypothetical protein GCM10010327_67970 [Streptomyces nitrosporeus]
MNTDDLPDDMPAVTLPVHIHIGPGTCRELGTIDLSLADDNQQMSDAISALLRSAADRIDRASAVIATAEATVHAMSVPD